MQSNSNFAEVVRFDCLLLTSAGLATQVGPDLSHPTLILSSKDTTNKSSIEMRGKSGPIVGGEGILKAPPPVVCAVRLPS